MDTVLLDTNVVSFLEKSDTRADLYRPHLEGKRHAVCFMTVADAWIAAAARKYNLPLLTHNRKHFEGIAGLTMLSEAP